MNKKMILCPSILNLDIDENYTKHIHDILNSDIDIVHIDIMDGTYVPNFGMSIREIDYIRKHTNKLLDVHLMLTKPRRYIKKMVDCGIDIIYIHPDSDDMPSETIDLIHSYNKQAGIVINPYMSLESIKELLYIVDWVMIMGVNPGYVGRSYLAYIDNKVDEFDKYRLNNKLAYKIILDGGADKKVIKRLYYDYNVDGFVIGKQVFFNQKDNYNECIKKIRSL